MEAPSPPCTDVAGLGNPAFGLQKIPDGGHVEPSRGGLRLRRAEAGPVVVPLRGGREAAADGRVGRLLPQHHVAPAEQAGLGPRAAVLLVLQGLPGGQLQAAVLTGDQTQGAL